MTRAERPFEQHRASTIFLRVPTEEWPHVASGRRREFRASSGNAPQLWNVVTPTFAVCYRKRKASGDYDWQLMVLESVRQERLGSISDAGLVAAGYTGPRDEAFARWRRDWMLREKKKFTPSRHVLVYGVRPIRPGDREALGQKLLEHLYGEFLAPA